MTWSVKPTDFIKVIEDDLVGAHRKITSAALNQIVSRSPVDTGRFKNNHKVSVDEPVYDIYLRYGETGMEEYIENGRESLSSLSRALPKITPYSIVYIQNNLEYALDLEEGSSKKAPNGVYKISLETVEARFK